METIHTDSAISLIKQFYGSLRLSPGQVASVINKSLQTVRNEISMGTFPIPSHNDGRRRYFDARDVAAYLDAMRAAGGAQ